MFKRILVPLDGSARAESALPVAARIARASGGGIVLVQVVNMLMEYGPYLGQAGIFTQETMEIELEAAETYLRRVADKLHGVETKVEAIYGAPALAILSVVHEQHADLVVICSHGHTGFKRWVLGSVAQKVVQHSAVPVLVLHEGGPIPAASLAGAGQPVRAIVALDGSALAKEVLLPTAELVSALSAPARGSLHLTRVVKLPMHGQGKELDPIVREQALHKATTYLSSVVDLLGDGPLGKLNLSITWSVTCDEDAAHGLIKLAEDGDAAGRYDLIALATHGRGGLQRWALGSVTGRVINSTKLPLMIVRPHQDVENETYPS